MSDLKLSGDVANFDCWMDFPINDDKQMTKSSPTTIITPEQAANCTCGSKRTVTSEHKHKCVLVPKCAQCQGRTDLPNGEGHLTGMQCPGFRLEEATPEMQDALKFASIIGEDRITKASDAEMRAAIARIKAERKTS